MTKSEQTLEVDLKFTLWETVQLYLVLTAQTGTWAQNDLYREISASILPSAKEKELFLWEESIDISGGMQIRVERGDFDKELSRQISIKQWKLLFSTAEAWRFWPASLKSARLQEKMITVNERMME